MIENPKFLLEVILRKLISETDLKILLEEYNNNAFDILLHMQRKKLADKTELGILWADTIGIAFIDLGKAVFQSEIVEKLPEDIARKHKIIPIYHFGNGITVATSNPTNSVILNRVEQILEYQVSPLFAFPEDIEDAIAIQYASNKSLEELANKFLISPDKPDITNNQESIPVQKEHDDIVNDTDYKSILINMPKTDIRKLETQSVILDTTKKVLVDKTRNILDDVGKNKLPDLKACDKVGNIIMEEAQDKLDVIFCIRQLRINDEQAYSHTINVAMMSSVMAKMMGFSVNVIKELTLAAFLHDIGKMRIPKKILYKDKNLTPQEIELIKKHTSLGYQIIKMMGLQEKVDEVALHHHERMDGKGYPIGLKGEKIPLYAQIVSIIDVYEYLLDKRNDISHHEAINLMMIEGQNAFNSNILYQFVKLSYNQEAGQMKKLFKTLVYGDIL